MARRSVYKNIIFIEGDELNFSTRGLVEYDEYSHKIYAPQILTLNDVKDQMAEKALQMGANAIINFGYGKKTRSVRSVFDLGSSVKWYAHGIAVVIPPNRREEILKELRN